jgi:glycosyltransferase involved in cell wall biosynthesis
MSDILPLIDGQGVEFLGEIDEREKTTFLGSAAALLFPIDWPEPCGLVMIEAMACGTPVLAFRCGSVPEIVEDGVTGKVVESEDEAIAALPEVLSYDRRAVRERFQERFTATRMAGNYVKLYRKFLKMPANSGEKQDFGQPRTEIIGSRELGRKARIA